MGKVSISGLSVVSLSNTLKTDKKSTPRGIAVESPIAKKKKKKNAKRCAAVSAGIIYGSVYVSLRNQRFDKITHSE